ncbi:MAG: class I SAM-dependent RNA methyltransferase [Fibrobacter sp.]|nr:class I SAM-dependent RNA methyltransferase [Fibrobacter sp.]
MNKTLTIEKMIFGGYGLARTDTGVIFVEDALPGETVECSVRSKVQGVPLATPLKYIEKSDKRRLPLCKYYDECGGCNWLHIDPLYQADIKRDIFLDCLSRIGKIKKLPDVGSINSPDTNYRIRAQIKTDGCGMFGFFKKKTNDIVRINECPLLDNKCNDIVQRIQGRTINVSKAGLKVIAGTTKVASDPVLPDLTSVTTELVVGAHTFMVKGDSFFQSNRFTAEEMGVWAKPFVGGDYCVDLYGGTGFFSIMLADVFKKVTLIELVGSQVSMARKNFDQNGCSHCQAVCSDSGKMHHFIKQKVDCLIVDPPRLGLTKEVRQSIQSIKPHQLLYISCNPSTQARDVASFINNGYTITNAVVFDCYPNTSHIETGIVLSVD